MMKEEEILTSESLRNKLILNNESTLDKIKAVPLFPKEMFVGIAQAAYYYNVPDESIKGAIRRYRTELEQDGLSVLVGKDLEEYKKLGAFDATLNQNYIGSKCRSFTKISKRGLLRIGMILTKSDVAKAIRTYLLNLEAITTTDQKEIAIGQIASTDQYKIAQQEVKDLKLEVKKEEALAKREIIQMSKSMKKLMLFGISKTEAALIVQHSSIYSNDSENAIYNKIKELQELDRVKSRGVIRLKIVAIAYEYYDEKIDKVYHILSEKMKFIIGIDMQAIRAKAKKAGTPLREIPSYLDYIAEYRAVEDAQKVLDKIVEEAIADRLEADKKYKPEESTQKKKRIREDKLKNQIFDEEAQRKS